MLNFYCSLGLNFYFLRPVFGDWHLSRGFRCNHNIQSGHNIHSRLRLELRVGENACLSQTRIVTTTIGSQMGKRGLYFLKAMAGSLVSALALLTNRNDSHFPLLLCGN